MYIHIYVYIYMYIYISVIYVSVLRHIYIYIYIYIYIILLYIYICIRYVEYICISQSTRGNHLKDLSLLCQLSAGFRRMEIVEADDSSEAAIPVVPSSM